MGQSIWKPLLIMLILVVLFDLLYTVIMQQALEQGAEISYSRFKDELAVDNVKRVTLKGSSIKGNFRGKTNIVEKVQGKDVVREVTAFTTILPTIADQTLMPELTAHKVEVTAISTETSSFVSDS